MRLQFERPARHHFSLHYRTRYVRQTKVPMTLTGKLETT